MTGPTRDDDDLAQALAAALRTSDDMPEGFVQAGLDAFGWLTVDAELAELARRPESDLAAAARAEPSSPASLSFTAPTLSLEVELAEASLEGLVVPPAPGSVEVRERSGRRRTVPVDEHGWFRVAPPPAGGFQICYRAAGTTVVTEWTEP